MKTITETQIANRKSSEEWPPTGTQKSEPKSKKGAARRSPTILPYPNTYQFLSLRVQKAFHQLRGRDYECFAGLLCCQTCALSSIVGDRYVFWHAQDADYARRDGSLSLAWGGEPGEIIEGLRAAGLVVEWDGDHRHRMVVRLPQGVREVAE